MQRGKKIHEENNQSVKTDPELTPMLELAEKRHQISYCNFLNMKYS
jgi:hypothetical protein